MQAGCRTACLHTPPTHTAIGLGLPPEQHGPSPESQHLTLGSWPAPCLWPGSDPFLQRPLTTQNQTLGFGHEPFLLSVPRAEDRQALWAVRDGLYSRSS